jgi:hypothetical protein
MHNFDPAHCLSEEAIGWQILNQSGGLRIPMGTPQVSNFAKKHEANLAQVQP